MALQPHQQRVVAERDGLKDRLVKLDDFIEKSPVFQNVDPREQDRLRIQRSHMSCYLMVLEDRIQHFDNSRP